MAMKPEENPATCSAEYLEMESKWTLINDLLGGTESMRAAGERHLPKFEEETDEGYAGRLNCAVLANFTEQTLTKLASKPFADSLKLNEDIPAKIVEDLIPDIDLQGNSLEIVAKQWFRDGLANSFSHCLVEYPRLTQPEDGRTRTLADDAAEGVRPYWVLVRPQNLIFAEAANINGREVLTHIRIQETYTERVGFAQVERVRIKVIEPGYVWIWVPKTINGKIIEDEWVLEDEYPTAMDKITLVTFYADRKRFMVGKPPLEDLAHLNVAHWQSAADQRHILTVARFPILACSGASEEDSDPIILGIDKVLYNPNPNGKFYYVEHTGAAIEAGRKDLKDLEEQMAGYGAQFLKDRPGSETATARALDTAEATSDLGSMTRSFMDAVALALDYTAEWMGLNEAGGTIELETDYSNNETTQQALEFIKWLREKKDISREAVLQYAMAHDFLPEDFDPQADLETIMDEIEEMMGASLTDLNPDEGDQPKGEGEAADEGQQ